MKIYFKIGLLGFLMVFYNCSKEEEQTVQIRINHYQNVGFAVGPVLTFLVQEGKAIGTNSWSNFYSSIEGFDYEAGYTYMLSVKIKHIDNPPADASSYAYRLEEIISKEKVTEETLFAVNLKLEGQSFIALDANSAYTILNQIPVDCHALCSELNENIENQHDVIGVFKHLQNNEIQLIQLQE